MNFNPEKPGNLGKVSFSIPIRVGVFGFLASCCITFAYHKHKEYRETLTFFATCIAGTAAATGTFYVGQGLKQNALEKKMDRTLAYIERWSDPAFDSIRRAVIEVNHQLESAKKTNSDLDAVDFINNLMDSDNTLRLSVNDALNLLEDVSSSVELGIVDEVILQRFYRSIMLRHYDTFNVWIVKLRSNNGSNHNQRVFRSFTNLCERWQAGQTVHQYHRSFAPVSKV
jgi:hypothetical protein